MTICNAIREQRLLAFTYGGYRRVVEPHTYGSDGKGHLALRAYQVEGGSETGEQVGWKLFHVDKIGGLQMLDHTFAHARAGYRQGDPAFRDIQCQL